MLYLAPKAYAGIDTFKRAISEKADMVVVHHGHFWKSSDPSVSAWQKKRLNILFKNDISLYAAHLPLDRHKEVGNNALLLNLLGASIKEGSPTTPNVEVVIDPIAGLTGVDITIYKTTIDPLNILATLLVILLKFSESSFTSTDIS